MHRRECMCLLRRFIYTDKFNVVLQFNEYIAVTVMREGNFLTGNGIPVKTVNTVYLCFTAVQTDCYEFAVCRYDLCHRKTTSCTSDNTKSIISDNDIPTKHKSGPLFLPVLQVENQQSAYSQECRKAAEHFFVTE